MSLHHCKAFSCFFINNPDLWFLPFTSWFPLLVSDGEFPHITPACLRYAADSVMDSDFISWIWPYKSTTVFKHLHPASYHMSRCYSILLLISVPALKKKRKGKKNPRPKTLLSNSASDQSLTSWLQFASALFIPRGLSF